jgi:hypothetical protein
VEQLTLRGFAGADILDGGDGIDTASYEGSSTSVNVSLATHTGKEGDAEGDMLTNIENLFGSSYDDPSFVTSGRVKSGQHLKEYTLAWLPHVEPL